MQTKHIKKKRRGISSYIGMNFSCSQRAKTTRYIHGRWGTGMQIYI